MGVLQPWLLALAAAAAVPLLLHLLQRHQGPRVVFPALRYLRRAEKESARRVRLRQLLLMLLRVGAVLLVAFAAARPFLLGAGGAHQPSAVVVVLDNSLSTGAVTGERRVLDELKARALETLAAASDADRFWLLRTGAPEEPALSGDAIGIAAEVRATEPVGTRAGLPAALARAQAILATGSEGRAPEIQLLTDGQASEWQEIAAGRGAPALLVWTPATDPPPNHTVSTLYVAGGIAPLAGVRTPLSAEVRGTGENEVGLRLFIGDRLVSAGRARPGTAAVLTLPAQPAGLVAGRVEADPDALRADDRRYFAVRVRPAPAVFAPGAPPFITDALAVMAEAGRVRPGSAQSADVALLAAGAGVTSLPPGTAVIVLAPTTAVELPAVNRRLESVGIGWQLAPVGAGGEARLAVADSADPLLRTLAPVRLTQHYALAPRTSNPADSVLLRLHDGTPWLVRGIRPDGGTWLLLGTPLTPEATSIPTSAAMIPLLDRMLTAWTAAQPAPTELLPGAEVKLADARSVITPAGTEDDVASGTYRVPYDPGIYQVRGADSILSAFAVNAPAAESDLRRADPEAIGRLLPGWRVRTTDSAREWARAMYHARLGLQLWRPLLAALLAVLIVEAIVAATGARRRAAAPGVEAA